MAAHMTALGASRPLKNSTTERHERQCCIFLPDRGSIPPDPMDSNTTVVEHVFSVT